MGKADEETLDDATRVVRERDEHIAALRERIDHLSMREQELAYELERARAGHDQRLVLLNEQLRAAQETIRMMQATRVWHLGHSYWRARGAIRRLLRRP